MPVNFKSLRIVSEQASFDPEQLIKILAKHSVQYVLIGALAARLHGFPRLTADADITPASGSANLQRLAAALQELNARVFTESVPQGLSFDCSADTLKQANMWNLITSAGRLDIAFQPSGTSGYEDLAANAVQFEIYGSKLQAAGLKDIIRSKKVSDRPQDRQDIIILREMLRRNE
jgi:hypothetical protein